MAGIPKDPVMLMSFLNTKLRDQYSSLEELCQDLEADQAELEKKLELIDYRYDAGKISLYRVLKAGREEQDSGSEDSRSRSCERQKSARSRKIQKQKL